MVRWRLVRKREECKTEEHKINGERDNIMRILQIRLGIYNSINGGAGNRVWGVELMRMADRWKVLDHLENKVEIWNESEEMNTGT